MRPAPWMLILGLAVAGCDQPAPPSDKGTSAPSLPQGDCGAEKLQGLVGQSESVVRQMTLPQSARVIQPGQAITADFRPDRLNVEIGKDGRIGRIGCY